MVTSTLARSLRALGFAAVVLSPLAAGTAFAEGYDGLGPSAYPAWTATQARTPLASASRPDVTRTAAQVFLQRSGVTGGDGQHG